MADEKEADDDARASKEEKLAQALRANLRRRKAAGPGGSARKPQQKTSD
ncbi:hypothetical protein [Phenylobacterium sp.]|nr:hypothetical protein [Phenylobacterium sp.]